VELLQLYAVNSAAPIWLMGFFESRTRPDAALRIVNISSGAAVRPFPGFAGYGSSKAALRMAGMVLAAESESPGRRAQRRGDLAILSFEPGVVDTEMQMTARSKSPEEFPWVDTFRAFVTQGVLVQPAAVAAEIAQFLEADGQQRFTERRFGA
jgi:benzil reductase ((S)-benzoin forming)